jgi:peroxiredoxin
MELLMAATPLLLLLAFLLAGVPTSGQALDQHGQRHDVRGPSVSHTVVEFAAAWCKPCYKALPRLEALSRRHPGIRFLVVSVDEASAGRDRLIEELNLTVPVLWDEGHAIVESFHPEEFPATYVLDRTGKVVHEHFGYAEAKIDALAAFLAEIEAARAE